MQNASLQNCLQNCLYVGEIAAYLDRELSLSSENAFEKHLTECAECSGKLNEQKRLLCALDFAFDHEKTFELPLDFARVVAVRAESNVSGLRSKDERRGALLYTVGLLATGFLVGTLARRSGVVPVVVDNLGRQIFAVSKVLIEFCYDFGLGLMVILRVLGRQFNVESTLTIFLLTVLLITSCLTLSGLLFKFHRSQESS